MEPMYIYATPTQVKQWHDEKEKSIKAAIINNINQPDANQFDSTNNKQEETTLSKFVLPVFLLIALFASSTTIAQTSQQKSIAYKSISPDNDHYKTLAKASTAAIEDQLESINFPSQEFKRGAYLKMRTVYLDIPVTTFKLKPFPANSSEQTRQELDFLLTLQDKRTIIDIAHTDSMAAIYYDPFTVNPNDLDYSRNVNSLFYVGRNLGPWFNPAQLPITNQVLQNVIQDATFYIFSLKAQYNRARPYHLEPRLQNLEAPGHASYPSGHSSASHVHAYLLSYIMPEYKEQFMGNAYEMAFSREIRGVHYPSDSEAGREFADQFVTQLLKNKKFKADLQAMKTEIQQAKLNSRLSTIK